MGSSGREAMLKSSSGNHCRNETFPLALFGSARATRGPNLDDVDFHFGMEMLSQIISMDAPLW